jgi:hypothetical protein
VRKFFVVVLVLLIPYTIFVNGKGKYAIDSELILVSHVDVKIDDKICNDILSHVVCGDVEYKNFNIDVLKNIP